MTAAQVVGVTPTQLADWQRTVPCPDCGDNEGWVRDPETDRMMECKRCWDSDGDCTIPGAGSCPLILSEPPDPNQPLWLAVQMTMLPDGGSEPADTVDATYLHELVRWEIVARTDDWTAERDPTTDMWVYFTDWLIWPGRVVPVNPPIIEAACATCAGSGETWPHACPYCHDGYAPVRAVTGHITRQELAE